MIYFQRLSVLRTFKQDNSKRMLAGSQHYKTKVAPYRQSMTPKLRHIGLLNLALDG